ncbi:MAG: SAM-dependent methyltransferase [Verrucomicrobiota bacterium]|nr:SAM-dependent methyltransferase [Verrucomicrobiota bacterium]
MSLLLLPNLLDPSADSLLLPAATGAALRTLSGLIAENEKEARRFLFHFLTREEVGALPIVSLNEHTASGQLASLLVPMEKGEAWGLISDRGLPCVSDPGANLVSLARQRGISVRSLGGTSSLLLALQLSGFSGERFTYHGYLPREEPSLCQALRQIEKECVGRTQMWIEAPYRTAKMVEIVLRTLSSNTLFCVAAELTGQNERVIVQSVAEWKRKTPSFGKEAALFLVFKAGD